MPRKPGVPNPFRYTPETRYTYKKVCERCSNPYTTQSKAQRHCTRQCWADGKRLTSKVTSVLNSSQKYAQETGCVICGERRKVEAAHITPRKEGGSGHIENIVPLCPNHHACYDSKLLTENEHACLMSFLETKFFQHAIAGTLQ